MTYIHTYALLMNILKQNHVLDEKKVLDWTGKLVLDSYFY